MDLSLDRLYDDDDDDDDDDGESRCKYRKKYTYVTPLFWKNLTVNFNVFRVIS
jgi:hypothetical protein